MYIETTKNAHSSCQPSMSDSKARVIPSRTGWPTPQKSCIKALHEEAGWSEKAIAQELSIPRTTVCRLLKSSNDRRDGKTCKGQPIKLSSTDVDALIEIVTGHGWKGRVYT